MTDRIAEGFPHQRMVVLPPSLTARAARGRDAFDYVATAAGYFPDAAYHHVARPQGTADFVLIACVYGCGTVSIASKQYEIAAGQVAVLPQHVPHAYRAHPLSPWTIYWLHFGGRHARTVAHWMTAGGQSPVSAVAMHPDIVAAFDAVFGACVRACASGDAAEAAMQTSALLSSILARRKNPEVTGDLIEQTLQYMSDRISSKVSVTELAHLAKLSRSQFAARFKQRTGTSVLTYFIRLKMRRAAELLDTTTQSINQIARMLGYEDALYFSRQFRSAYGLSPKAYRSISKG